MHCEIHEVNITVIIHSAFGRRVEENGSLGTSGLAFPAVERHHQEDDYSVYLSSDIGPTVSAIIVIWFTRSGSNPRISRIPT